MKTKLVPGVGRMPYPAYRGKEPYIFVSYAHVDSGIVFKEIQRFNEAGFHVWYDEGIAPGNEWTDEIANALSGCTVFVVMITPRSAVRTNVQNEVNYALDEGKPVLAIHLEETALQGGIKLRLNTKQAILKYTMSEEEYAYKYTDAFIRMGLPFRNESKDQDTNTIGTGETKPESAGSVEKASSNLHIKPEKRKSQTRIIIAAVVCVVVIAAVFIFIRSGRNTSEQQSAAAKQQSGVSEISSTIPEEKTNAIEGQRAISEEQPSESEQQPDESPVSKEYEDNVLISDRGSGGDWYNSAEWTVFGSEIKRGEIGSVSFLDTLSGAPANAWDVSMYVNGSVMAWVSKNGDFYDLYIAGDGGVSAPSDCSMLFCGYENAVSFQFGEAFHTDNTKNMSYMFGCCSSLRGIDLSCFRTENVADMSAMFQYCSSMRALNISSFDTSCVTNMERMFMDCELLEPLDLSSIDGSKVTDMSEMFLDCYAISEINLGRFTSEEVTDLNGMFFQCHALKKLTLGKLDASNVPDENKENVFKSCDKLTDVYYGGTEDMWKASGLGETLPAATEVHFEGSALKDDAGNTSGITDSGQMNSETAPEADYDESAATDKEQEALKKAKIYIQYYSDSYTGLKERLEKDGFSEEEAGYAADHCGADWNEQAVKAAEGYIKLSPAISHSVLVDQLVYEGFTQEQAEYAATAAGV